ncbi:hypothetical protein MKZ38_010357 [Zalerion maritima]|uniref:Pre-mRNA-splicing factor CWC22 n=1 Tax=Zalerion maritima TaxID=339359 RepID=A0AAD5S084_9PEZI|nr:hypothetical protein MKZ38_010357 [Zalerion maritima]
MASVDTPPRPRGHDDQTRSSSPPRGRSPARRAERPRRDAGGGGDRYRPKPEPKRREEPPQPTEEEKQAAAKREYEKLLTMRSGGTYIPPARLRALQAQITDKTSKEYQRMAWEALKKSINGLINKVNVSNIKFIVPELFNENLMRGRGLFCRSIMKAQAASLPFTSIYAAMTAIVNSKLPKVGELLIKRLVMQFRKAFKRNDKTVCRSAVTFIAHLVNQFVVNEMLAAQILLLLLHKPTDDSVELAVSLTREVGAHIAEANPTIATAVFDRFRNILYEADIDKRVQYMIEVLFQVRKDNFKDNPSIKEELDLVPDEDQITHQLDLDGEIDVQDGLNIFKFDPNWEETEASWRKIKAQILGEDSDEDEDDEDDEDESSEEGEADEQEKAQEIKDQSNTDLVNLRRTIYLTIMSSMDPEECVHKLMKINLPQGQEPELPSMIVECCSQEKTYSKFFGLIGERFAKINRLWTDLFEESFQKYYDTIHRYETNRLRNIARFFGHMFGSDAFGWHALSCIHLNEEETTSSSRIFIKILFQDIAEEVGMPKLQERMKDQDLRPILSGLFPKDNPKNIRFSINYFTSIGMGALTEEMREFLANMPKTAPPTAPADNADSDSDSDSSYSSYTGSSYSRTPSRSPRRITNKRARSDSSSRKQKGGQLEIASTSLEDQDAIAVPPAAEEEGDVIQFGLQQPFQV